MENKVNKDSLKEILAWAKDKAHIGNEPPWAWYQYMKLIDAVESILKGMDSTITPTQEDLPQLDMPRGSGLRLVDHNFQPNTAQPHQGIVEVQLPM